MNRALATPRRFSGAEEALYEAACARAGLSCDDVLDGIDGLGVLLYALDHSPAMSPAGVAFTWSVLANTVAARIWAKNGWRARPDCLKRTIAKPIVITGLPRSGTTALHKLLSVDPQFQGIEHWLTDFPSPRPPREKWTEDSRYRAIVETLTAKQDMQPGLKTKHLEVAEEVDECLLVLKQSFVSNFFGECIQVPDYDAWWMEQDESRMAYPWFADVLRLIGADDDRRWLLKNPGHMWAMDALFASFPDARVLHLHRAPERALPSMHSLVMEMRRIAEGPDADPRALSKRDLKVWSESMKRMLAARDRRPDAFIDVWHDDFNAHPLEVIRDLYSRLGLVLEFDVEEKLRTRIAATAAERRQRAHGYNLEMFGLTEDIVRSSFSDYITRFHSGVHTPRAIA